MGNITRAGLGFFCGRLGKRRRRSNEKCIVYSIIAVQPGENYGTTSRWLVNGLWLLFMRVDQMLIAMNEASPLAPLRLVKCI